MDALLSHPKWFVLNFVPCPSCNAKLEPRITEGDVRNVYCTWCDFSARFVSSYRSPDDKHFVMRKADLEQLLTLKKTLPPLITHFKWESGGIQREQVEFYPFFAFRYLQKEHSYTPDALSDAPLDVAVFSNMFDLPTVNLYMSPSDEELAEHIAKTWPQPIHTSRIQREFEIGYTRAANIKDNVIKRLNALGIPIDDSEDDDLFI